MPAYLEILSSLKAQSNAVQFEKSLALGPASTDVDKEAPKILEFFKSRWATSTAARDPIATKVQVVQRTDSECPVSLPLPMPLPTTTKFKFGEWQPQPYDGQVEVQLGSVLAIARARTLTLHHQVQFR